MRQKAKNVQRSFVEKSEVLTLDKFVIRFKGEEKDKFKKTLEVFREHNEQMDRLSGKNISKSTAKRYWTCYNHIEQFIHQEYRREDFQLKDVDHQFITRFEYFLKTKRECNHNSALKYVNNFKKIKIYNWKIWSGSIAIFFFSIFLYLAGFARPPPDVRTVRSAAARNKPTSDLPS